MPTIALEERVDVVDDDPLGFEDGAAPITLSVDSGEEGLCDGMMFSFEVEVGLSKGVVGEGVCVGRVGPDALDVCV